VPSRDRPDACDLVVEAMPELPEIKVAVLAAAERAVGGSFRRKYATNS
jgi:3-hydroxyacyl-CoA dehydrogenase